MPFDPDPLPQKVVIPSDLHSARRVEDRIVRETEELGYSPQCAFAIRLALEEAMVNAHKHGNHGDPSRRIAITYSITPKRAVVRVRDEGGGFDPQLVQSKGYGLTAMRQRVSDLGGKLCLRTAVGGGTQVSIRIPIDSYAEAET